METLEAISKRASLKLRLSARDVEPEKIVTILNAARLAPSGGNRQPWCFIVVKDKQAIETLVTGAFRAINQVVREAPVIIVACSNPSDEVFTSARLFPLFDLGLAVENMVLAATDLGLVTHLILGFDAIALKKILNIPQEIRFVVATPIAYPAGGSYEAAAQEKLSQRTRKDLPELVYLNTWGSPFQLYQSLSTLS